MKIKINYFQRNGKLLSVPFPTQTAFGQILALARAFVQHDVSCKENTELSLRPNTRPVSDELKY